MRKNQSFKDRVSVDHKNTISWLLQENVHNS